MLTPSSLPIPTTNATPSIVSLTPPTPSNASIPHLKCQTAIPGSWIDQTDMVCWWRHICKQVNWYSMPMIEAQRHVYGKSWIGDNGEHQDTKVQNETHHPLPILKPPHTRTQRVEVHVPGILFRSRRPRSNRSVADDSTLRTHRRYVYFA